MTATTVVRNSIVGDAWIQQTAQAVPVQRVIDQKTGKPTGDILTGPVRLAFQTLFELPQASAKVQNPKYGAILMFTPYADFSIFYEEYYAGCAEHFASHYDAGTQQYYGLHSPFRDQAEKLKFGGFTPGLIFLTCTSKFKPPIIDVHNQPVTDRAKVYPGVWAICSLNRYKYDDPRKKGIAFGLQNVMIIGDDTKLGGEPPDPTKTFAGVAGAITAPVIQPGALAHLQNVQPHGVPAGMPPGTRPPMTGAVAPPPPGGTYAAPGAGRPMMPPGAPVMPGAPVVAPGAPVMPGTAPADPRGAPPQGFSSWVEYDDLMG